MRYNNYILFSFQANLLFLTLWSILLAFFFLFFYKYVHVHKFTIMDNKQCNVSSEYAIRPCMSRPLYV